ncbi:hypothetical protein ACFLXK_00990 [Chloroflexota bacterium]
MFSFKVLARSVPAICVVTSAFMYFSGDNRAGGLFALLALVTFALPLIMKKL